MKYLGVLAAVVLVGVILWIIRSVEDDREQTDQKLFNDIWYDDKKPRNNDVIERGEDNDEKR